MNARLGSDPLTRVQTALRSCLRSFAVFVDPRPAVRSIVALPWYFRSLATYRRASRESVPILDLSPQLLDRLGQAGEGRGHYYYQDLWAARRVHESRCRHHVDVGSRVDGFVAHCAVFTKVTYVDIRPLYSSDASIEWKQGGLERLPFDDETLDSISCLHVIEHVGLGRYGDPLNSNGSTQALQELNRVLAPGGNLLLGVPIGRERVCFNAHRVLAPATIMNALQGLTLRSFSAVDDEGQFREDAAPEDFAAANYACGLFHFSRPANAD